MADATEALFYHLERQPLDKVLPSLLERTLERGWRAVVQAGNAERIEALDTLLWTYSEGSFLPHGTSRDGMPERQPIFLTTGDENPNQASVRFLVDGATPVTFAGYTRVVLIFDGHDQGAVADARRHWKAAKEAGCQATYWQQGDDGRWQKRA
ncbi:MAG TPA: DNA polymerase III subunit chi [Hyphomicrobiaceae bacterium]|nr:DNA polymerase III subunit chi [Hyphomicrobiaceae bacterium]